MNSMVSFHQMDDSMQLQYSAMNIAMQFIQCLFFLQKLRGTVCLVFLGQKWSEAKYMKGMEIIKHKYCDPFYTSFCDVSNSQHRDSSEAIIVNAIFMTFGFELISFNQSISPSIKCKLLQHRFNNASAPVQTDHFHRRIIVKNHVYGSSQLKVTCQPIIIPGSGYGGYAIKNGCAFSLDFKSLSSLQSFICMSSLN